MAERVQTPLPARRLAQLRPSPIRLISEGAPPGAIPLGLGEPTWALPEPARLMLAATPDEACAYGPNTGLPELRQALGHWHGAAPEEVLVTTGSEEALMALFLAYLDPGDQVLVPDPGYPAYAALARLAGAEPAPCALDEAHRLDPVAFEAALAAHPRIRVAVLNGPSNPTGAAAGVEALAQVARACEDRGILLISDEVYRELHGGTRPPSLRDVTPEGIVVSSVSKAWGAAGLRVGWAVGREHLLAPARLVHGFAVTCAAVPSQRAALALLETSDRVLPLARHEVDLRWEALAEGLKAHLGLEGRRPDGGFYLWLPLPDGETDALAFCLRLRDEAGVVLVPGGTFGAAGERHLRLSFAARPGQIREGLRRMAPHWRRG